MVPVEVHESRVPSKRLKNSFYPSIKSPSAENAPQCVSVSRVGQVKSRFSDFPERQGILVPISSK